MSKIAILNVNKRSFAATVLPHHITSIWQQRFRVSMATMFWIN